MENNEMMGGTMRGIKSVYNYLQAAASRECIIDADRFVRNEAITAFNVFKIHLADELLAMGLDIVKTEY